MLKPFKDCDLIQELGDRSRSCSSAVQFIPGNINPFLFITSKVNQLYCPTPKFFITSHKPPGAIFGLRRHPLQPFLVFTFTFLGHFLHFKFEL